MSKDKFYRDFKRCILEHGVISEVHQTACGILLSTERLGKHHEQHCEACKRILAAKETCQ